MRKKLFTGLGTLWMPLLLAGCSRTQGGGISLSMVYAAAAVLSALLLAGYCAVARKRDGWFLLLFTGVLVVNAGYFALSVSHGLAGALAANRLAYLGSVVLPLSMLMILLNATGLRYPRRLPVVLLALAAVVFLLAASPGYLDLYYKEVTLATVGGATVLQKLYGPLHGAYALYLVGYFAAMVGVILRAAAARKLESTGRALMLTFAVLANLGVWFAGQLTDFDFEFLSISYLISELFLLGLHLMVEEQQRLKQLVAEREQALNEAVAAASPAATMKKRLSGAPVTRERYQMFAAGILELTQTERAIFDAYVARVTTKEIMATLNIKENTLKFHNKNLYQKLGVSSRRELQEMHKGMTAELECTADGQA